MFQIQNITTDAKQKQTLALPDGSLIGFEIRYVPLQLGWFITELTYKDFSVCGLRICNSPNLLYQFKNQLPFGLACFSALAAREPSQQEDFASGAAKLFILTAAEVDTYQELLSE